MNQDAANIIIAFQNVRWLKDEFGDYWVADLLHNGKRIGITGSYYSLDESGNKRANREEQEKDMEENLKGLSKTDPTEIENAIKGKHHKAIHQSNDFYEKPFDWFMQFDARQQKEIDFARLYARQYAHGTDGHNAKMIIAKLADLLDKLYLTGKI